MALASRVRALEEEKNGLMERLEEEEERAKELSRQIQTHTQQVRVSSKTVGCCSLHHHLIIIALLPVSTSEMSFCVKESYLWGLKTRDKKDLLIVLC